MQHVTDFLNELRPDVVGNLHTDIYYRTLYSTDASLYQVMPYGVLIPQVAEDLQAAVTLASKYHVPLLPRTGGSSLAGQATNQALVMDMTCYLNQVLELNVEEKWVRVQPGLVLDALNNYLKPHGLQFGPDPASSNRAAMGGIVSNNSTGSHSVMYGMTADHVLETTVLLGDGSEVTFGPLTPTELLQKMELQTLEGEIYRKVAGLVQDPTNKQIIQQGTPRHWRRCGGYNLDRLVVDGIHFYLEPDGRFNLAKLICGAEGTLGVITEMKLALVPRPKMTALAIVEFDELVASLEAVPIMLEAGPSAIELLDNLGLTLAQDVPEYARLLRSFLEGNPYCLLITEFYGETEQELQQKLAHLRQHMQKRGVKMTAVTEIIDPDMQKNVWKVRKVGLGLLMSIKSDYKPIAFIEDTAVPVQHLAEYIPRIENFCHDLGTKMAYYAHVSAGCLHIRPLINTKLGSEVDKLPRITEFVVDLLGEYGGAFSSEHGDGKARSWLNERFFGSDLYGLFREVKGAFDPHNIMNPGNIVDAPPMTKNLRYGADYTTTSIPLQLDFRSDGGFDRAVEMCNGAGVCRKTTTGVMCPSFMATGNEQDSTRGRANMLRAALSGRIPPQELTSPRMYQSMELCISCKACKSECPSSVDMAKIKQEFLAHYYTDRKRPLRDYLFTNFPLMGKLGSGWWANMLNWGASLPPVKKMMEATLGISAQRTLPRFNQQTFLDWYKQRPLEPTWLSKNQTAKSVVLFNDALSTYSYPEIAIAATEVLQAGGCSVTLAGVMDAGRPALSKGMIAQAKKTAVRLLDALYPFAKQGLPIIFLEPSDLSCVIDDYSYLLPDDERVAVVAEQCMLFEQYIAQEAEAGRLKLSLTKEAKHILLHGHCHQKALLGTKATHQTLTLPPNYTLEEVDSSCCGMAGSFGYEAEHYDISLQMGERRLLTAVRSADARTLIAAPGVSCRQQIKHGTGRMVYHPAQVLRDALQD